MIQIQTLWQHKNLHNVDNVVYKCGKHVDWLSCIWKIEYVMGGQQVSGVMHIHVEGQTFLEKSKKIYTPTQNGPKSNENSK